MLKFLQEDKVFLRKKLFQEEITVSSSVNSESDLHWAEYYIPLGFRKACACGGVTNCDHNSSVCVTRALLEQHLRPS